ncbi:uncharacterized protein LOC136079708 isoform X1 [Hydra vulgaris]|uniref:Uncharacterized protein LOC136079708 isoform X1 n=1 Tax=Hydra vulgaris TaxID=6087 RepID=A0ABM4BS46_HYDVU
MFNLNSWHLQNCQQNNFIEEALYSSDENDLLPQQTFCQSESVINEEKKDNISQPASSECLFSEPPSDLYTKFSYGNDNIFKYRNVLQEQLASWATKNKCSRASINELLSILKNHGPKDLSIDSRTLLKSPRHVESLPLGISNGVSRLLDSYKGNVNDLNTISLVVNIDGLPLFKSSNTRLWPILCSFSGLSPFFVAVCCGTHKPDPVSDFINDFLEEYSGLNEDGLNFNGHLFQVKLKYLCNDAPARAMLKSIKPHNGYNSCKRCIVEGEYKENRVVFNDIGCA